MSYEGYEQCICEDGHYYTRDCYSDEDPCITCGKHAVWINPVDETNYEADGYVPYPMLRDRFMLVDDGLKECDLGHYHRTRVATFRIPTREETDPLRETRDSAGYGS